MPERLARCTNRDYCTLGDRGAVLRLAPGDRFFCPECAHALAAVPDRRRPEAVLWPVPAVRLARCVNRDYCRVGDQGTVLKLAAGAPAFCPECAHALTPVQDRRERPVPWEAKATAVAAIVTIALLLAFPHRHSGLPQRSQPVFQPLSDPAVVELKASILGLLPSPDGPLRRRHHRLGPRLEPAAADARALLLAGIPVAPGMPWHEDRAAGMPWRQALILAALMTPGDPPTVAAPAPPAEIDLPHGAASGGQSASAAPADNAPIQVTASQLQNGPDARSDAVGLIYLVSDSRDAPALAAPPLAPPPAPVASAPAALWKVPLVSPPPPPMLHVTALVPPDPYEVAPPPSLPVIEPPPTPLRVAMQAAPAPSLPALPPTRALAPRPAVETRIVQLTPPPARTVSPPAALWSAALAAPAAAATKWTILGQPAPLQAARQAPAPDAPNASAPHPRVIVLPASAQVTFGYGPLKDVHLPNIGTHSYFLPSRPATGKPAPGSLTVDCEIETTGVPTDCRVLSAQNAASVTEALLGWLGSGLVHYPPKTRDGEAVRARRVITVDFPADHVPERAPERAP